MSPRPRPRRRRSGGTADGAVHRFAYPIPTVWFALAVALSGLALFAWPGRSWSALWGVEGLLAVLFVVDTGLCASPRRIAVHRDVPETIGLGDRADLTWTVENHHSLPARVTVTDALWPSLDSSRRSSTLTLAAGTRQRLHAELHPTRRGRFPLNDVTVRVTGRLRMVCRQATRSVPGSIKVMPAFPSREEVQRRLRVPRVLETGSRTIRTAGGGTDFDQLRDYRPDDEFRRIDWGSSVRMQRPIVKQYRAERNQNVVVLLDNGRVMAGLVDGVPRVEHAMDAALAITQAANRLGDRVGLLTFDHQVRSIMPAASAKNQVALAAEAMFALQPELVESAYQAAFSAATQRFRRRSLYVVLTDLVEATVDEALLPALPILTRRHVVVVAGVFDPQIAAWADGGHHEWASEAYRQAAAVAAVQRRRRAVARLRAAGALVVDAAPGRLGIDLVDAYLEVKASGRL
jgi:uncharacterized protein (DUF58 family)